MRFQQMKVRGPWAPMVGIVCLLSGLGSATLPTRADAGSVINSVRIKTSRLTLHDDHTSPIDLKHRTLRFSARTGRSASENRIVPPVRGSGDDPTLNGGTVVVANTAGSGERVEVVLPPSGWKALGTTARPSGFEFIDVAPDAPIAKVVLKKDRLTVKAGGAGWAYTLDETTQVRIALQFQLGETAWCADALAHAYGDPAITLRNDQIDIFRATRNSDPPRNCLSTCTNPPYALLAVQDPDTDQSAELTALLAAAAANPAVDIAPQGRVFIGPGLHRFAAVVVPSNVRIEVSPAATLTAPLSPSTGAKGENPLFIIGATTEVSNITITAGDGCGGPGSPTRENKLHSTAERGNSEANGMSNIDSLPHNPRWPIETMFVVDLDARFRNIPSNSFAALVGWSNSVELSRFFSIQNPERVLDPLTGDPTGPTIYYARNPVVKPRAIAGSTFAAPRMPQGFKMEWVYNVLSPSGWGPIQVQSCLGCTVSHVFSHGGVALRMETDHAAPLCGHDQCDGGCIRNNMVVPPTDEQGVGFGTYARVDNLTGTDIEGAYGNVVVTLSPHCQHNGYVNVSGIRGTNMTALVSVGEGGSTNGTFSSDSAIADVVGEISPVGFAQGPMPQIDTYGLQTPQIGLNWTPTEYTANTAGFFCWPSSLPDIFRPNWALAPVPVPMFTHTMCP